jgi:DNA invertase Pin-like site-specific DNA recombinase
MALERMAGGPSARRTRRRRQSAATGDLVRVIMYGRVSTGEQATKGGSLAGQRAAMEAECDRRGWPDRRYTEDPGESAATLDRPALQQTLALLASGDASVLMVGKVDRLTRNWGEFGWLLETAQEQGWALVILSPALDLTTAFGRAMAGMVGVFAQLEREMIADRTREGIAQRKALGTYREQQPRVPERVRARIRQLRAEGLSYQQVAARLNLDGLRTSLGFTWRAMQVYRSVHDSGSPPNETTGQDGRPPLWTKPPM